jgi:hypothetical protein
VTSPGVDMCKASLCARHPLSAALHEMCSLLSSAEPCSYTNEVSEQVTSPGGYVFKVRCVHDLCYQLHSAK